MIAVGLWDFIGNVWSLMGIGLMLAKNTGFWSALEIIESYAQRGL
jgi:hypothetical protein